MHRHLPEGMLHKQFRWEWVNNQLYNQLRQLNPFPQLKKWVAELIRRQELQLSLLQGIAAYYGKQIVSQPLAAELNRGLRETVEELYDREYQLLQEYLSYAYYFVPVSIQSRLGIPLLIESQMEQVNQLTQLQQTLRMIQGAGEAQDGEGHHRQQQNGVGAPHHDQGAAPPDKQPKFMLEKGYRLIKVASGLTYPTDVTFDDQGNIYIAEAGFAYGGPPGEGRILKLEADGSLTEVAGGFQGPVTSITWHRGYFYVAEGSRGKKSYGGCGQVTRVSMDGRRHVLVSGLRTCGDHFTGEVIFGPDGYLYFSAGTATNSGVVGPDNAPWLKYHPHFHDVPARTLVLRGSPFISANPLTEGEDVVVTGAYHPFGKPASEGEEMKGQRMANGVIYRCKPDGTRLQVYADGFRNTFGLGFSPFDQRLYVTDNGADPRGSRPIQHDWDSFREVERGSWHGWPDFFSGLPATLPHFQTEEGPKPGFLLKKHPPLAAQPLLRFKHHSSSNKFDFSTHPGFGHVGQVFVAQTGDMNWGHHEQENFGFKVVRCHLYTGQIRDFLVNPNGEATTKGPIRPVEATFSPDGRELYVVDFGRLMREPRRKTGALWKIVRG
ncbi:MAG: glucose dehydrogenase [Bacillaceae bacterium]|nr:glucose dehydrogenase [Bacillaceae bacterium]